MRREIWGLHFYKCFTAKPFILLSTWQKPPKGITGNARGTPKTLAALSKELQFGRQYIEYKKHKPWSHIISQNITQLQGNIRNDSMTNTIYREISNTQKCWSERNILTSTHRSRFLSKLQSEQPGHTLKIQTPAEGEGRTANQASGKQTNKIKPAWRCQKRFPHPGSTQHALAGKILGTCFSNGFLHQSC